MRWLGFATLLLLVAGCGTRACKAGTVLVSLTLQGNTVHADALDVLVNVDGKPLQATVTHVDGVATGTLEIDFPGAYPVGKTAVVSITARAKAAGVLGAGQQSLTLGGSCAYLTIIVTPSVAMPNGGDGGSDLGPQPGDGAPPIDGSSPPDLNPGLCGSADAVRCNPTNHHFEQHCDASSGLWTDVACPQSAQTTVYACTDSRNRCVHTGWVQWRGSEGDPKNRSFTTISDTSGKGEDIVKDNWTGLSWQLKIPSTGAYTWDQSATPAAGSAQAYCAGISYGGFSDWRVPAPIELMTLVDRTVPEEQPMVQLPFTQYTFAQRYWTSLGLLNDTVWLAYVIDFSAGYTTTAGDIPGYPPPTYPVRCVR